MGLLITLIFLINPFKTLSADENKGYEEYPTEREGPPLYTNLLQTTIVDKDRIQNNVYFDAGHASSVLDDNHGRYGLENAIDNNPDTAWSEGSNSDGSGETIEFYTMYGDFPRPVSVIKSMAFLNGYTKSEELFYQNNRVKMINIIGLNIMYKVQLQDVMDYQIINFPIPIISDWIKIEIERVYQGSKHNDLCLSEMYFMNLGAENIMDCVENCQEKAIRELEWNEDKWKNCLNECEDPY